MWDFQEVSEFDSFLLKTNKVNASSLEELFYREREISNKKTIELNANPIQGNFDYQHLKDIHKYIFQDIFTWAGKDRFELKLFGFMYKGDSAFCAGEFIPNEAKRIFENLEKQNYLKDSKSLDSFAHKFADLMSDLNALHPFREGNGRTQRIFLNQLAQNTGYKLDLNLTPKDKMIEASISGMQGNNLKLESIIRLNLKSFKQNLSKEKGLGL